MKNNKAKWLPWPIGWITGHGTYQEAKYEEDADGVMGYYRDRGYITARVGDPELKVLEDSKDKRTRWVQLRIPVNEGDRYRIGKLEFGDNKVIKTEGLQMMFKMKPGDWYSDKAVRKGLEKAREVYGSLGYFEFTGYPDLKPHGEAAGTDGQQQPAEKPAADAAAPAATPAAEPPATEAASKAKNAKSVEELANGAPLVDVTLRMQEGKQYFVNRITFTGNSTTRDNVIRREVRLYEGGVFNTEALKFTIKRLNQLGYFKQLEGDAIKVDKTPNVEGKVDVTLKLEEQNRNQLTFGAGVSQYEGFFGQLAFQTSNFLGRGETFSVGIQAGSRAQNYQLGFTEPFLFDRPITGGIDLYKREVRYISQYTQGSLGGNIVFGFPVRDFTRGFINYAYETVTVSDLNPFYNDPDLIANNPYLADALLLGDNGRRSISKIVPSLVHNTVDNPIFPTAGRRFTVSMDFAGLGGNVNFLKPRLEGVYYFQQTRRLSLGVRGQFEYIKQLGSTEVIPIFERLFLGGEYSVRGFDIRSIGPRDPRTGLVLGGNKSLLFNAEYLIQIAGPVRLVLFYDAGEVPRFRLDTDGESTSIYEPFRWSEFKTSTGAEVRFFMPVLNVPFRLIFAINPQRAGIYTNQLQPAKFFQFRFAVGSTF
jgi:outer membrane protein insertion porin family